MCIPIEFLQSARDSFAVLEQKTGLSSEIMKSAKDRLDQMKKDKRAVKRNKECLDEAWLEIEPVVFSAFVCSKACLKKNCDSCFEVHEILIKCNHCKKHLCAECDLVSHINSPFHQRTVFFFWFHIKTSVVSWICRFKKWNYTSERYGLFYRLITLTCIDLKHYQK